MFKHKNISLSINNPSWVYYLLVFLIGFIPLFYNLGGPVMNLWDESRRAVNSYEMLESGNLIVTRFNGEPEMWGTKPPLLIWAQTLSMKLFGVNEWALRFPSALAGLLLGFLLVWFAGYFLKSHMLGLITILILYTSGGYVSAHSVRTADFDAILVLFTTASSLMLFLGTETHDSKMKKRFIMGFFILLTLAALTKGIAAFIMGPAYLFYLIYRKELLPWLRNRNFWTGMAVLFLIFGGFYFLRNLLNPGYFRAVLENEVTGRYMEGLEENKEPFSFYFRLLYQLRFQNWYFLLPLGLLFGYLSKDTKLKRLLTYLILLSVIYLGVISMSETKLQWYDLPVFPFISMISAVFFYMLFKVIRTSELLKYENLKSIIPVLILLFFFASPYLDIYEQNSSDYLPFQDRKTHAISHFLRDVEKGKENMPASATILYQGEFQHFLFYVYKLRDKDYDIMLQEKHSLNAGKNYLVYQEELTEKLKNCYPLRVKNLTEGVQLLKIRDE